MITCLSLSIFEETKIRTICKQLGVYKLTDFDFENLTKLVYFFVKSDQNIRKEIKYIYLLLSDEVKFYDIKYFHESQNNKKWEEIGNYKIDKNIYFEQLEKLNKGKFFLFIFF